MDFVEHRLVCWVATPEGEEADHMVIQVHLRTDHAMNPMTVDGERVSEHVGMSLIVGSSQKDDLTTERFLQVESPSFGEGTASWCRLDASCVPLTRSDDVACRSLLEDVETSVFESRPDLSLPAAVERFDRGLKAGFVGDGEDGRNAQAETQPNDTPDRVAMLARSAESIVVIELSVIREPDFFPVLQEPIHDDFGGNASFGPGGRQAAMQRNARENREIMTATNGESFNGIEAVQFGCAGGDTREVPTLGRSRPTDSLASIERAMPDEDAADGADRGELQASLLLQFAVDGRSAIFAQRAVFLESGTNGENTLLNRVSGSLDAFGNTRTIFPVNTVQSLPLSACDPMLDGGKRDAVRVRHRANRPSFPNARNHFSPFLWRQFFLP